jgi:hypothetical protein
MELESGTFSSPEKLIAVTGYGAWFAPGFGVELYWEGECELIQHEPLPNKNLEATIPQFLIESVSEAMDCAGLGVRSIESKRIVLIAGLIGEGIETGLVRFLTHHFHFLADIEEHIGSDAREIAPALLERGMHFVTCGSADVTIICVVDTTSPENAAGGAVSLVLEREQDAVREEIPVAALLSRDDALAQLLGLPATDDAAVNRAFELLDPPIIGPLGKESPYFPQSSFAEIHPSRIPIGCPGHPYGALLKAMLAVERGVFPPNAAIWASKSGFHISTSLLPWFGSGPENHRSAAVVFARNGPQKFTCKIDGRGSPKRSAFQHRSANLFVFSAIEPEALAKELESLTGPRSQEFEAARLAANKLLPWRAAIVAKAPFELAELAAKVAERIRREPGTSFSLRHQLFYSGDPASVSRGSMALMFPGQGSQFLQMNRDILLAFPGYRDWIESWSASQAEPGQRPPAAWIYPAEEGWSEEEKNANLKNLFAMEGGGQAGFVSSLAMHRLLESLDVKPDCMVGYSNGENAALLASGAFGTDRIGKILEIMRQLKMQLVERDAANQFPQGTMLAVSIADRRPVLDLIAQMAGRLFMALDNCPQQLSVFSTNDSTDEAVEKIRRLGGIVFRLPFDRP